MGESGPMESRGKGAEVARMTEHKGEACGEWEREEPENWWAGGAAEEREGTAMRLVISRDRQSWGKGPGRNRLRGI